MFLLWYVAVINFCYFAGIFVALALRFDVSRGNENRYFRSAFLGYTVGLILTIVVMNWFQAAQVI
jgi:minor histocompatibility antigen H13